MPDGFARSEAADRDTVLQDVRHHVDLRMPLDEPPPGLLDRRLVEIAEAPAERHQIVVAQHLIPKEQHLMIEPRLMDRGKAVGVERAQVDALHLGAERGAGRPNAQEARRSRASCHGYRRTSRS